MLKNCLVVFLILVTCAFMLAACSDNGEDYTYGNTSSTSRGGALQSAADGVSRFASDVESKVESYVGDRADTFASDNVAK